MALAWEIAEFASDQMLGTIMQQDLPETMIDLICGMAGAIAVIVIAAALKHAASRMAKR